MASHAASLAEGCVSLAGIGTAPRRVAGSSAQQVKRSNEVGLAQKRNSKIETRNSRLASRQSNFDYPVSFFEFRGSVSDGEGSPKFAGKTHRRGFQTNCRGSSAPKEQGRQNDT
jgi:hypothetical protein